MEHNEDQVTESGKTYRQLRDEKTNARGDYRACPCEATLKAYDTATRALKAAGE